MITVPEPQFERLCHMARTLFEVPIALLYLPDRRGSWIDCAPEQRTDWEWLSQSEHHPKLGNALVWMSEAQTRAALHHYPQTHPATKLRFIAHIPFGTPELGGWLRLLDTHPHSVLTPSAQAQLDNIAAIAHQWLSLWTTTQAALTQEAQFRLLAEHSTDILARGNLDGMRVYISPAIKTLLGYEPEELIGTKAIEFTHPEDIPAFKVLMQQVLNGELEVGITEQRQWHKNGSWVWVEAFVRLTRDPITDAPNGYVASVRGMDRRKALENRLTYLASYDNLTGLANRTLFNQQLSQALTQAKDGASFVLLFMDIDHFKQINDTHGHQAGDALLQELAQRFRAALRSKDHLARLGGDEFTALLKATPVEATLLAKRLIATTAQPFRYGTSNIAVGLSVGIACIPEHGDTVEAVLSAADQALYQSKRAGKNTFRFFTAPVNALKAPQH